MICMVSLVLNSKTKLKIKVEKKEPVWNQPFQKLKKAWVDIWAIDIDLNVYDIFQSK